MSKRELKEIATVISQILVDRRLISEQGHSPSIQTPETDGYWCKIADTHNGIIDLWLDAWRSHEKPELYYGYWSSRKTSVQRVRAAFCDEEDCMLIGAQDETNVAAKGTNRTVVALKTDKALTCSDRFLLHLSSGHNWFGRYARSDALEEMIDEAVTFFDQALSICNYGSDEGSLKTSVVNRYERDPALRAAAIRLHGCSCAVCNMSFSAVYGAELGKSFIHVHHLSPLSEGKGKQKTIDPKVDLLPVCPNCHAMLHRRSPPVHPDELRKRLQ